MASVSLEDIGKLWGASTALESIDLHVPSGSFCVLLGPSGCGKSTTLRIIAGLETPSSGCVLIGERDVTALPPSQRGISMVFQNYALFPHLTVADNITFGLRVRKLDAAERARRLAESAELLGLGALLERKPSQLSGGQQQRVALGRALVSQAGVCLMDEPLSNLDAQLRQEMRHELRELQRQLGLTVIYVTHDQAEAMSMADQVVLLRGGRLEQVASAPRLYAEPATIFAARFIGTPPMNLLALEDGRIAGSDIALPLPQTAAWLGVRPEAVRLERADQANTVRATIADTEYLGADRVIRCAVGQQQHLLVRADGRLAVEPGQSIGLYWDAADTHAFDVHEHRLSLHFPT
ncbi:MAG: ABC transporter ATP-binding protein [Burkholderiales bacterium]|nr:ABC transporter ATP-binding protein [Burkholderiales bacterium]